MQEKLVAAVDALNASEIELKHTNFRNPPPLKRVYSTNDMETAQEEGKLFGIALRLPCECNFNCLYCNAKEIKSSIYHKDVMSFIDQAIALGIRSVSFVGEGEPFMYDRAWSAEDSRTFKLMDIVEYLTNKKVQSIIYSNTSFITPQVAARLLELDTVVVAKQNGGKASTQESLTGVGTWKTCMDGIRILEDAGFNKDQNNPRLSIHTVATKFNIKEIPDMWISWRKRNIVPMVQILESPSDARYEALLQVTPNEIKDLFYLLAKIDREMFGFKWVPRPPIAPYGCTVCSTSAGLRPNGEVSICAYTDNILGNIMHESLEDILNKDMTKKIRDIDNNLVGHCTSCAVNKKLKCSGCRAHQVSLGGSVFDSYEFCWNNPEHKETALKEKSAAAAAGSCGSSSCGSGSCSK